MATQANAVATREEQPVVTFRRELEARASEIKAALPQHISAEKFQRTVTTAVMQNPDLLKADRRSLLLALMKSAQDGLLPDGREAALVTFKNRVKEGGDWVEKQVVQYMPMVYGLRKKILQATNAKDGSPLVVGLQVGVVYRTEWENGYFRYEVGTEPPLRHRVMLDIKPEEAKDEDIVAAYSIATMAEGPPSIEVMRRIEIDKVRQVSQTGAVGRVYKFGKDKGKPIPPKGPWVDWFPEMAKKTVVRRHSKMLPQSGDILIEHSDDAAEFEAASGAAALLGSEGPDAPRQLTDEGGDEGGGGDGGAGGDGLPPHDRETGELLEEDAGAGGGQPQAEEPAAEPSKTEAALKSAEKAMTTADGTAKAGKATGQQPASGNAQDSAGVTDDSAKPAVTPAATAPEAEAGGDSPELSVAEAIADRMDKVENIIDLERAYDDSEDAINELDGEERGELLRCYANNRRRLGARTAEPAQ